MHRLARDEGAAGELRVGEPRLVCELFEARVLRDGQVMLAERDVHRGAERNLGAFEYVAHGGVEIDLTHVNILT